MRLRHSTTLVAVFCVLLHAGFLVRHNGSVLAAAYQQALGLQVTAWCGPVPSDAEQYSPFDTPAPKQQGSKCPICMGVAPAAALLSEVVPAVDMQPVPAPRLVYFAEAAAPRITTARPPSRAPPFLA